LSLQGETGSRVFISGFPQSLEANASEFCFLKTEKENDIKTDFRGIKYRVGHKSLDENEFKSQIFLSSELWLTLYIGLVKLWSNG
jgi:hypothetical protein